MKQSLMLTKNITATFTQTSGYIMRCILQAGTHLLHERIHELELTQTQWLTMVRLTIHGESTAAQLARGMMLDAATMMRILKYLEARGFIIRLRSKTDRRIINITLSTAGRSIARIIERGFCNAGAIIYRPICCRTGSVICTIDARTSQ